MRKIYFIVFSLLIAFFSSTITAATRDRGGMGGMHGGRSSASFSHTGSRGTITRSMNNTGGIHTTSLSLTDQAGHTITRNAETGHTSYVTSHSVDTVATASNTHTSMHRTAETTIQPQENGKKSMTHTVSAQKSSMGEVINGHIATTHLEQGNISHEGWARATNIPMDTSFSHDGTSSIVNNGQNQINLDHTGQTSKFFQEALVTSHESNIHTSIQK